MISYHAESAGTPRNRWVMLACCVGAAPLLALACHHASFQNRLARCVLEAERERQQCRDDVAQAPIPRNSYMMEGLVRNCDFYQEYYTFRCTHL